MTVKSADNEIITEYLATKCGFVSQVDDGRLWVFREGSEALVDFVTSGEPAKQVIRPAAGPMGMTIKSTDTETINEYLTAKTGYVTRDVDGRVWILRESGQDRRISSLDVCRDIQALGCVFHFALTGTERPGRDGHELNPDADRGRLAFSLRDMRTDVPRELNAIHQKMGRASRSDGYQSVGDVIADLWEAGFCLCQSSHLL